MSANGKSFFFFVQLFFDLFFPPPRKSKRNSLLFSPSTHHVVQVDEERVLDRHVLAPDLDGSPRQLHLLDVFDAGKVPGEGRERRARVHDQGFRSAARDVGGEERAVARVEGAAPSGGGGEDVVGGGACVFLFFYFRKRLRVER